MTEVDHPNILGGPVSWSSPHREATEAYQLPRIVRLGKNLYGACFSLMKLVPARHILTRAVETGRLGPDTVIVETTSGTFGLALAMQAARLGRKLVLVSDYVMDDRLCRRITDLGAEVERVSVEEAKSPGGYQGARLRRVSEIRSQLPDTFCPEQYSNPDNPGSYGIVADLFLRVFGRVDCVVGPVGSGGSMCGTVGHLRRYLPRCQAVGVDTHGSVLFGHPDQERQLRGLGMSILPTNLDHRAFDSVHWCSAAVAFAATRQLHQEHALFMGPTSGAAYQVGRWWARHHPEALTVVMLPDEGHRYQDSIYDDRWLEANGYRDPHNDGSPIEVTAPEDSAGPWTWFKWGRRSYLDVQRDASPREAVK